MSGQRREYDLSVNNLPESWIQAELDSPTSNVTATANQQSSKTMPTGLRTSSMNILLSSVLGAFVAGLAWYFVAWTGVYTGPWIAVAVAASIALVVRLACGPGDIPVRALSSVLAYLTVVVGVLVALAWAGVTEVYGEGDFATFERFIIDNRLKRADHLVAYGLGVLVTIHLSHLTRHR